MSKKIHKIRKAEICLEPDGYSIHTLELSQQVSKQEWQWIKDKLYKKQQKDSSISIYPNRTRQGQYCCTAYSYAGIRVVLEKVSVNEDKARHFVRIFINPRKLIYPQSGYLGILPNEEESVELLGKAFHEVLKNSPFDDKISRYYLSRVDLCTNLRCNNKRYFASWYDCCGKRQRRRNTGACCTRIRTRKRQISITSITFAFRVASRNSSYTIRLIKWQRMAYSLTMRNYLRVYCVLSFTTAGRS